MFEKFLRFFLVNSRMNHVLFVLIFAMGIWSYQKMPKEVMPTFELDMVSISGNYTGASVDVLDKMAVVDIEDSVKSVNGVTSVSTVISPGKFLIILEFQKGLDRYDLLNKVKDAVTANISSLPKDMDEPIVKLMDKTKNLVDLSLTSDTKSVDEMKEFATNFKSKLHGIKGISEVNIIGDSDKFYEVILDDEKIEAYGISKSELFEKLTLISYIFPVGEIEGDKKHYYLSTHNGAKTEEELANTLIKLQTNTIYLKDIAKIKKKYEDATTLYSYNGKYSLSLSIKQNETANALEISKDIRDLINKTNSKDIKINISNDDSKRIVDRLNVVSSNILFGIILISMLVALLINARMAFVIILGIPTSFLIGAIYMYLFGYSINIISLVGVLIAIGIIVDDAIIVSENVQQHIEKGMEPKEAAITGAKEMAEPIFIASITTIFSFIPLLMITGSMGEVMKLIPIALSVLVIASFFESFIFLPIHASHSLKSNSKVTSWEKVNKIYNSIIHFFMEWKKTFLLLFIVLVPVFTVFIIKQSKFQMFPQYDVNNVKISIKGNENNTLEESFKIVQKIEEDLLKEKDKFFIKSISSTAGYRRDASGNTERNSYVMHMTIEFTDFKGDNIVENYISPALSFFEIDTIPTRTKTSMEISKMLSKHIEEKDFKKRFLLDEIDVVQQKVGPIKSDIQIGMMSNDLRLVEESIIKLEKALKSIEGVTSTQNSIKYGNDEIKLELNEYGKSLGLTESFIGSYLSNLYSIRTKSIAFDANQMIDIKIRGKNKDEVDSLKNTQIPIADNKVVYLKDVCHFNITKSIEQIVKDDGKQNFFLYANVDPKIITASEVLEKLNPLIDDVTKSGVQIVLKGEAEKNRDLKNDMMVASALALLLILLSLLYLFNSFRETFIVMSVIPFSFLGVLLGHQIMGLNLSMPSLIGALGLAGVVINDGIVMMTYLKTAKTIEDVFIGATRRFRPIILTTVTTLIGMLSLILYPSGESAIFQPIAVSLAFGLAWGTVLNLLYLPVIYTFSKKLK
ncbi:MAG: efflux RND transporter permease subunit, partial [Epsilonproteobacteria bacterium]|nr:efflux RND transporter permease subunit [Campylobacterota bacterium]